MFQTGASVLPQLPKEAGDRNRTSPFAFTGNKFEFRAVGSSANISGANTVLNTIVAESLDYVATELEKSVKDGKSLPEAIQALLPGIIKESKKVIFNGNGYSAEWHAEAEKRGLPNLKNTVDALPVIIEPETIALFEKYKVYTAGELKSRYNILSEAYVKAILIEGKTAVLMAKTQILPAALKYQKDVADSVASARAAGVANPPGVEILSSLVTAINALIKGLHTLEHAVSHEAEGEPYDHAKYARDNIIPGLVATREAADTLEALVDDAIWPLPKYREMLFIK
jgi:glutamine synthetase